MKALGWAICLAILAGAGAWARTRKPRALGDRGRAWSAAASCPVAWSLVLAPSLLAVLAYLALLGTGRLSMLSAPTSSATSSTTAFKIFDRGQPHAMALSFPAAISIAASNNPTAHAADAKAEAAVPAATPAAVESSIPVTPGSAAGCRTKTRPRSAIHRLRLRSPSTQSLSPSTTTVDRPAANFIPEDVR